MSCYIGTMHRIDFAWELTALEVREPFIEACQEVAAIHGLFAKFQQPQQQAFRRRIYEPDDGWTPKVRIGNGKHKAWRIDYQQEPPAHLRPTVIGAVVIKSLVDPSRNQYGGFDYGEFGESKPVYNFITLHTIEESGLYLVHANDELYQPTVEALEAVYPANLPRLF